MPAGVDTNAQRKNIKDLAESKHGRGDVHKSRDRCEYQNLTLKVVLPIALVLVCGSVFMCVWAQRVYRRRTLMNR